MSNLKWEKLSSKYLVKEKWATLRVDACKMPNGTVIDDYYVLEYPDWVNAVALTEDNQVVLIRQYRHAAGEVFLEVPGGCVDPGEAPEVAVRRELLEETGYEFDSLELVSTIYANPSTSYNKTWCYLAKGGKKVAEQSLDGAEEIEVLTVSLAELKKLLLGNKFGQALHISSIFYALTKLGELK
ncbi:NUDIX hydrolase [Pedobacter sp. SYSU D00535]|uniref:NUDIX hydrolase n=1 Tax=Pedobacter sp. SYSU D00535 TaxID=2810308 RepID=UPI001A95A832|nr:NUDIX hydrolase [Pedobacter sp. SYSU D00535]